MRICEHTNVTQWRQGKYHISKAKKLYRSSQGFRKTASEDAVKKQRESS
jgi:hypothetical protein